MQLSIKLVELCNIPIGRRQQNEFRFVNLGGSYQTRLYRPVFDVWRQIRATSPQAKTENALFC